MPTREIKRTPAFFPINIPEDASSDSSASRRDLSPLVSGTAQIVTVLASPTTDQDTSDETPDSPVGSIDKDSQDMEQLEYQYRPMTPGEEESIRIHEDVIYRPPDMIEKPGGLHIKGSSIRDGGSCTLQTASHHLVVEAFSDLELEELLRDTPEPGTPPVTSPGPESPSTPGAARITTEIVNGSAEDMEAYQQEVIVEGLLPWLKDDISSS